MQGKSPLRTPDRADSRTVPVEPDASRLLAPWTADALLRLRPALCAERLATRLWAACASRVRPGAEVGDGGWLGAQPENVTTPLNPVGPTNFFAVLRSLRPMRQGTVRAGPKSPYVLGPLPARANSCHSVTPEHEIVTPEHEIVTPEHD